jgi:intracellular multiplication protein IcmD
MKRLNMPQLNIPQPLVTVLSLALVVSIHAAETGIGGMAAHVTNAMNSIARLIGSLSYIIGLCFFLGALLKFKQHRDNPTQVPVGTPFTYFGIAILMIFMPMLITESGKTVFSSNLSTGGVSGSGFTNIGVSSS